MKEFQVIAHRGASSICPENTMIAFERAMDIGSNAIETDVQMTKDGALVLIHDEQLERTTNGTGWVKDYLLSELKELDAGSWFSSSFKNARIPTIDELFSLIAETNLWVNIEIKMGFILYPGIEEALVKKIKEYHLEGQIIVSSFNHYSIKLIKKISSDIQTAILYSNGLYKPWKYAKELKAIALHPHKNVLFPVIVKEAHHHGMKVYPYTVDDKEKMRYFIESDVDGIMTNVPDKLISLLRQLNKR